MKKSFAIIAAFAVFTGCITVEAANRTAGDGGTSQSGALVSRRALEAEMWNRPVELREGVTLRAYAMEKPRKMKAYVAKIDLSAPGIGFTASDRDADWGKPMPDCTNKLFLINTKRERTPDFMMRRRAGGMNVEVAVNTTPWAPWFHPYTHKYGCLPAWNVSGGVELSSGKSPERGAFFVVYRDGSVEIASSVPTSRTNDVVICMSGFEIIMRGGKALFPPKPDKLAPRMAIGLDAGRRTLVFLAVDGRQPEYSLGADLHDLCDILRREGVTDAVNMDGGGSTSLVVFDRDGRVPWMLNHHAKGAVRKNAVNLGVLFGQ